jgi:hypothetical protein
MPPDNTSITDGRVRLIKAVAAAFVVVGIVDLVFVLLKLADLSPHGRMSVVWIGDIIIGLGLLRFSRGAYIAALWWTSLKLILNCVWLIWLIVVGVQISQSDCQGSAILAAFQGAMTLPALLLAGLIALAVWQLWVLSRPYTRLLFGCGEFGTAAVQNRGVGRPQPGPRRSP